MVTHLLVVLATFLLQAGDDIVSTPWSIPAILGPTGLTAFAVWLYHRNSKTIEAKDKEIERLNEERRKDLVSGMLYREQQVDRLLKNDAADRETDQKMVDAVKALALVLERTDENTQEAQKAIRDVEKIAIRLETRLQSGTGHSGDSSPDLRGGT